MPRNFQNPGAQDRVSFLRRRGIDVVARVKSPRLLEIVPGDCASAGGSAIQRLRLSAMRVFEKLAASGRREEAAVLASVVVGDYSGLSRALKEVFQNSGTYHVLVVSGLHVAWIAAVLVGMLDLLRVPAAAARLAVAAAIVVYSSIVGWQASISRALWMCLLHLVGRALFRNASPANVALASGFCLLAANTEWLFDAGFQLSFLSVLAICLTAVPVTEHCLRLRVRVSA